MYSDPARATRYSFAGRLSPTFVLYPFATAHRVMFSEPARSTRYSLPTRMTSSPSGVTSRTLTVTMNTAWAGCTKQGVKQGERTKDAQ